jgi:acylphosphatase
VSASEQLEAVVTGRVQGVGFRYFVVRTATALGLTGRVSNERDGTVRVVAEGDPERLSALEVRLREGPPGAVVTAVSARRTEAAGSFTGFDVNHAG